MRTLSKCQLISQSLNTKYRSSIMAKVIRAIEEYDLIKENDCIMVCMSGGKDSFLLAKCMQELEKHYKVPFKCHYVVMDPGYQLENRLKILDNAKIMDIPIEIYDSDIFEAVDKIAFKNPCYFCARMRRGVLYTLSSQLGCNKIALGHHFDDVIETTLLSMFYGSKIETMLPKLHSKSHQDIELIRPLYLVKEEDIIKWKNFNALSFIDCACKFSLESSLDETKSKRKEMKELIKELKKTNKNIDYNIFKSLENIDLNRVMGYQKDKVKYSFLDDYDHKEDDLC